MDFAIYFMYFVVIFCCEFR